MTKSRQIRIKHAGSSGLKRLTFSMEGRSPEVFNEGDTLTGIVEEDRCYGVQISCLGNDGGKASVEFEAAHKDFAVYLCTPYGSPAWTDIKTVDVAVESSLGGGLTTTILSVRRKSAKPSS